MRSTEEIIPRLKENIEEIALQLPVSFFFEHPYHTAFKFMLNFFIEFKPKNEEEARDLFIKAINVTGWRQCYGSAVTSERHHRYLGLKNAYEWFVST